MSQADVTMEEHSFCFTSWGGENAVLINCPAYGGARTAPSAGIGGSKRNG